MTTVFADTFAAFRNDWQQGLAGQNSYLVFYLIFGAMAMVESAGPYFQKNYKALLAKEEII